jgi:class 3 adenylate cyclase
MINVEDELEEGHAYVFACLQVDIMKHSSMLGPEHNRANLKADFMEQVEGVVRSLKGFKMGWQGDGGQYLFPCLKEHGYDRAVFAARRILIGLPETNKQFEFLYNLNFQLDLRVSIDSGSAIYKKDHSIITGDFINSFTKNERTIGLANEVIITGRVYNQLLRSLAQEFSHYRHSPELECKLYQLSMTPKAISFHDDNKRGTIPPSPLQPRGLWGARIDKPTPGAPVGPNAVEVKGTIEKHYAGALYLFTGSNGRYWPSGKIVPNDLTGKWTGKVDVGNTKDRATITLAVVNQELETRIEAYRHGAKTSGHVGMVIEKFAAQLVELEVKINIPKS